MLNKPSLIKHVGYLASDLSRSLSDADIRASWRNVAIAAGSDDVELNEQEILELREAAEAPKT